MIKIDKGVPIPTHPPGRKRKYPYRDLEPGGSFFVPGRVTPATTFWAQATGFQFTTRKVVEDGVAGVRVWRVDGLRQVMPLRDNANVKK